MTSAEPRTQHAATSMLILRHAARPIQHAIFHVLLLLTLVLGLPGFAFAQATQHYTFVQRGTLLDDALRQLITTSRIDLSYDPALVDGKRVFCVAENQPAEDILRCLLHGTGLDFYRLSSGLYVLTEVSETAPVLGNLQGIIVDRETGEPLANAHVLLADGRSGAVSNDAGRFIIADLKPGYYRLTTSFLGYRQMIDSVWVPPSGTAQTHLSLAAEPLLVTPIVVDGMQWRLPSEHLGLATLSRNQLLQSRYGGAPDVRQSLQTLVGVRLSDATSDLHVQGGEAGEHQFRLDGAPVFVPVSIGGLVGPFSPFAIGRITVHKSGFGADIGSQAAGVIQAEHALGPMDGHTLDLQADPLSLNGRLGFTVGTPGRTHAATLLAARYGLWDVYQPPTIRRLLTDWNQPDPFMLAAFASETQDEEEAARSFRNPLPSGNPVVGFYDLHGATRLRFGPLRTLYASTYHSQRTLNSARDPLEPLAASQFTADSAPLTRDLYGWSNGASQLRYDAVLSARLLATIQARASYYRLGHDFVRQEVDARAVGADAGYEIVTRLHPRADNNNRIQEYATLSRLDVAARDWWQLQAGIEPTYTFNRFLVQGTQELPITHRSSGWRVASFFTNTITFSPRLSVDVGTRLTYLASHTKVYAEPRLALRFDQPSSPLGPWSFRVATGLYRQFVNQFDVSSRSARALLATSRTWLAVDSTVTPPHTAHLAAEWLVKPGAGWTFRLEGYYKRHLHLLAVDYTAGRPDAAYLSERTDDLNGLPSLSQSAFLADGKGTTFGAAVLLEKQWRRARGEVRYEYSQARRSFGELFDGDTLPVPWNEPHRLEVALDWTLLPGLSLLGRWRGIWGRSWGFRQAYYDFLGAKPTFQFSENLHPALRVDIHDQIRAYHLNNPDDHHLPPILQLDLSAAYTVSLGGPSLQARLDLLNVLDRANVADWRFVYDPEYYQNQESQGLLRRDERRLMPFTPALALRVAW